MKTVLSVTEICGSKRLTRDDGNLINEHVSKMWDKFDSITIDFNNIPMASVSFLDQALGIFALDHDLEEVKRKLEFVNISAFDRRLLNDILVSRGQQRRAGEKRSPRKPNGVRRANR